MKLVLAALLLTAPAGAVPWHTFGPRAMGMGGAHVAIAQGPSASYWNPAGLGQLYNESGLEFPIGARAEFTGTVLQAANDLEEIRKACNAGNANICTQARATDALNRLNNPGNGALVDIGGGLDLKIKRVTVFVNNLSYAGATPQADLSTAGCAVAGSATCLSAANNNSRINLRGLSATEIGIGYGREVLETGLNLGVNLKGIIGKAGFQSIRVADEDVKVDDFSKSVRSSFAPGVDVGMLWDMRETFPSLPARPRLAVVGRNVNSPGFKNPDAARTAGERENFPLHGQGRAGLALSPFKWWHLALDADLTNNLTPVDGYKSRYFSAGTEVNIFNRPWLNIPLRAGIQKNLSDSASGVSYTGGFGFNFVRVHLDVAGMVSGRSTPIQSETKTEKVPNNFGAAARIGVLFGGADEGARGSFRPAKPAPKPIRLPDPEPEETAPAKAPAKASPPKRPRY